MRNGGEGFPRVIQVSRVEENSSPGRRPKTPHTPAVTPTTSSGLLAHRTGQESSERRKRLGNSFPADNTVSLPRRQTHAPDSFVPSAAHRSCGSLQSKRSTSRANNSSSRAAVYAGEKQRDAPRRGGPGGSFAPACRALVGARASDDERHDGNSMSSRHAGSHSNAGGKCLSLQKCVFLFPNLKQFSLVQIALSDRALWYPGGARGSH